MELFVYLRMGGQREGMIVRRLDDSVDLAVVLSRFDAGSARCFLDIDRQKLLAVIEAGFGDLGPFNRLVRNVLAERVRGASRRARGRVTLQSTTVPETAAMYQVAIEADAVQLQEMRVKEV